MRSFKSKLEKEMKITITGPRSIGKSAISKVLAKKLKLKYISSDEIVEIHLKENGGLDTAIKSRTIGKFIKDSSRRLIKEVYKKDNFVFDLAGGAISSRKYADISSKIRKTAKDSSIVIGLLPSKNNGESINFLFEREKERLHFKAINKKELFKKVKEDYRKFPTLFRELCDFVIYTKGKTPEKVGEEIINNLTSITIITDKDVLGREIKSTKKYSSRIAARAIVFNSKNKIALLAAKKYKFHKLPGGGLNKGENIKKALERELQEEIGCRVKIIKDIGKIIEIKNKYNQKQTSYCYAAKVLSECNSNLTKKEKDILGIEVEWVSLEKAAQLLKKDAPKDYTAKFIVYRDLIFLKKLISDLAI